MALYNISGGQAWSDLQGFLTSSVAVDYRGERIGLSSVRNLAYDPDPSVRKDAYEAELACYEKIKDSVAYSLNSIKLQVINSSRLRGFESPLAEALYNARMTRETLDALLEAMNEHMDIFRRYLKLKAEALGHKNGMPWYECLRRSRRERARSSPPRKQGIILLISSRALTVILQEWFSARLMKRG